MIFIPRKPADLAGAGDAGGGGRGLEAHVGVYPGLTVEPAEDPGAAVVGSRLHALGQLLLGRQPDGLIVIVAAKGAVVLGLGV